MSSRDTGAESETRQLPTEHRRSVGKSVERVDGSQKVTGDAKYGSDLEVDGMLYAAVVRSNRPHAEVENVETNDIESRDGVEAVVTREELIGQFDNRVRHYGDVVAAVAAEDLNTAKMAAKDVSYELTELDSVHDPRKALREDAPRLHENNVDIGQHIDGHSFTVENDDWEQNVDDYHSLSIGDVEDGLEQADHVLNSEYTSPRVTHCNLDTHCCLAEWDGEMLHLTETLASPHAGSEELGEFMGLDPEQIEIEQPPTASSSFGGRSLRKLSLEPVAATLARETDRPVKLWWDREEEFAAAETRHKTQYDITIGITDQGDITAVETEVVTDTGGYPNGIGHIVLWMAMNRILDLYDIPNYEYEGVSVFTNNIPAGEYRGIGSTQFWFAFDMHIDEVARQAGLDPMEVRRRNFVDPEYENPSTGAVIDASGAYECLEDGVDRFETARNTTESDPETIRGTGFSTTIHPTAGNIGETEGASDVSEVRLTVTSEGRVRAETGAVEQGQGSDTVVAQIVDEETDIPASLVDVERFPTTDDLTDEYGSIASRTTYVVGGAAYAAAQNLRMELKRRAGDLFGVSADSVTIESGRVHGLDDSLDITAFLRAIDEEITVTGHHETGYQPPSYGAHFAEVEIDPRTGKIDLRTYVAAQDVGYAINPKGVEGQLEGAVLHGIEFSLYSEVELSNGSPQNANLSEYPAITTWEMPDRLETVIVESHEEEGPYGAKGVGTPSLPPVAPAILNAVRDATGHRFTEPPVTSENIFTAINDN